MNKYIISNNPLIKNEFSNVIFIEGTFMDVLIKVRDMIYLGHELITHPLGASIRMLFSPYRSILVGDKTDNNNEVFIRTIESSIENYNKHMEVRKPDIENSSDYAVIDKELIVSAIKEYERLGFNN